MRAGDDETHQELLGGVEDVERGDKGPRRGLVGGWSGGDALAIDRTIEQGINRGKKGKQVKGRGGGESCHCGGGGQLRKKGQPGPGGYRLHSSAS